MAFENDDTLIRDSSLSDKTIRRLPREYKTLGDLRLNYVNLKNIKRFGLENLNDVKEVLGITITNEIHEKFPDKFADIYSYALSQRPAELQAKIQSAYPDVESFRDINKLFDSNEPQYMRAVEGCSKEENIDIRRFCVDVLSGFIEYLDANQLDSSKYTADRNRVSEHIGEFSPLGRLQCCTDENVKEYIELQYNIDKKNKEKMGSVRAINAMRNVSYMYFLEKDGNVIRCSSSSNETTKEIQKFYEKTFEPLITKALEMDTESARDALLEIKYPFLSEEQRRFVLDFADKHGYLPMFYIIYHYVCSPDPNSEKRNNQIIRLMLGFDGQRQNREDVAKEQELSTERIRQIVAQGIVFEGKNEDYEFFTELASENISHYAALLSCTFLTPYSEVYQSIAIAEQLATEETMLSRFNAFAKMLVSTRKLVERKENAFEFVKISGKSRDKDFLNILARNEEKDYIENIIQQFTSNLNEPSTEDKEVGYTEFVNSDSKPYVKDLIQNLSKIFNASTLTLTDDGVTFLGKTKKSVDVPNKLLTILKEGNKPMNIRELLDAFTEKYPEYEYDKPESLKPYIFSNEEIVSIGKTGTYTYKGSDIDTGTIRDKIEKILSESEEPMLIDDILQRLTDVSTNKQSLLSSMRNVSERFVEFEGQRFGIVGKDYGDYTIRESGKRLSVEQQLGRLAQFLKEKQRFPFNSGEEEEIELYRWMGKVRAGKTSISDFDKAVFDFLCEYCESLAYPKTNEEYEFLQRCNEYRDYLMMNHRGPDPQTAFELAEWYIDAWRSYSDYSDQRKNDQRKKYFDDLQKYIEGLNMC